MSGGTARTSHEVRARNTATTSENRIHDDTVARGLGFSGGLVPGVTVFAYLCRTPLERFGPAWLERGRIDARFLQPVYDGDLIAVSSEADANDALWLTVGKDKTTCAEGSAFVTQQPAPVPDPNEYPLAPLPSPPPPAAPGEFPAGRVLGTVEVPFDAEAAFAHLALIGEDVPVCAKVAHPMVFTQLANLALSFNVRLGPWIHVSSDVELHGAAPDGAALAARTRVVRAFERGGHRFAELDVLIVAGGVNPVARVTHTAIYEPRGTRSL